MGAHADKRALVVLSGGQDSTTCLYWAKREFAEVRALCFDYGQRHRIELDSAEAVAKLAGVELERIDLGPIFAGLSPLTNSARTVERYASAEALPGGLEDTFVPGRNILFLSVAANRAYTLGADALIIGVSEEDFGGYPDCRADFIVAMEQALRLGLDTSLEILAPLARLDKAATVRLAQELDGAMEALAYSHTCYEGESPPCGACHACLLRARGFAQAGVADPLVERCAGSR